MAPASYEIEKDPNTHWNGPKGYSLHFRLLPLETGNFSQYPPVYDKYLYQDIWSNQTTARILENILGPKPELRYLGTNVVCPCLMLLTVLGRQ